MTADPLQAEAGVGPESDPRVRRYVFGRGMVSRYCLSVIGDYTVCGVWLGVAAALVALEDLPRSSVVVLVASSAIVLLTAFVFFVTHAISRRRAWSAGFGSGYRGRSVDHTRAFAIGEHT